MVALNGICFIYMLKRMHFEFPSCGLFLKTKDEEVHYLLITSLSPLPAPEIFSCEQLQLDLTQNNSKSIFNPWSCHLLSIFKAFTFRGVEKMSRFLYDVNTPFLEEQITPTNTTAQTLLGTISLTNFIFKQLMLSTSSTRSRMYSYENSHCISVRKKSSKR